MSDVKRYTIGPIAGAYAEIPPGTQVVLASDYDAIRAELDIWKEEEKERIEAMKFLVRQSDKYCAELESLKAQEPAQKEPVAYLVIDEPFNGTQGMEAGDWDIEPNGKRLDEIAEANSPGCFALYAFPVVTEGE